MVRKAAVLLVFLLFILPAASARAYDITVLKSVDIKPYDEALEGFRSSCDCTIREVDPDELRGDAGKQILSSDPDAVLAIGMDALSRLQTVTGKPVIYTMVPPSQVPDLQRKNFSGVSMYISPDKYLDAMTEVFPRARRIGMVYNPQNSEAFVRDAAEAAKARGLELVLRKTSRTADVPVLIDSMKGKIDLFWMIPDMTVISPEAVKYLLLSSFRNKVPIFTFSNKYVEMGALAALNIVPFDLGVQAGEIARKIAAGSARNQIRAGARKTLLSINGKVARKMGIIITQGAWRRAEDVN